jgi:autotransporter-associated beta strand protein
MISCLEHPRQNQKKAQSFSARGKGSADLLFPADIFVLVAVLVLDFADIFLLDDGTVTNNGTATAILTVGNDNTTRSFTGTFEDGTGVLQLTKIGTGTLILAGNNTYSGSTAISTGTLQIGDGGTIGRIVGDSGTTILGGSNTYSGGTILNNGTLLVNNAQALGQGDVLVNGGVLGADPQPINVKGNYT